MNTCGYLANPTRQGSASLNDEMALYYQMLHINFPHQLVSWFYHGWSSYNSSTNLLFVESIQISGNSKFSY